MPSGSEKWVFEVSGNIGELKVSLIIIMIFGFCLGVIEGISLSKSKHQKTGKVYGRLKE